MQHPDRARLWHQRRRCVEELLASAAAAHCQATLTFMHPCVLCATGGTALIASLVDAYPNTVRVLDLR